MSPSEQPNSSRGRLAGGLYAVLFVALAGALVLVGGHSVGHSLIVAALMVIAACDYAASKLLWAKVPAILDMGVGLALVAIAIVGPWAGFVVLLVPDLIHLAAAARRSGGWPAGQRRFLRGARAGRRGRTCCRSGSQRQWAGAGVVVGRIVVAAVNYTVARLVLAVIRAPAAVGADPPRVRRCVAAGAGRDRRCDHGMPTAPGFRRGDAGRVRLAGLGCRRSRSQSCCVPRQSPVVDRRSRHGVPGGAR